MASKKQETKFNKSQEPSWILFNLRASSISFARPLVKCHSTVLQLAQKKTVCEWIIIVVFLKIQCSLLRVIVSYSQNELFTKIPQVFNILDVLTFSDWLLHTNLIAFSHTIWKWASKKASEMPPRLWSNTFIFWSDIYIHIYMKNLPFLN